MAVAAQLVERTGSSVVQTHLNTNRMHFHCKTIVQEWGSSAELGKWEAFAGKRCRECDELRQGALKQGRSPGEHTVLGPLTAPDLLQPGCSTMVWVKNHEGRCRKALVRAAAWNSLLRCSIQAREWKRAPLVLPRSFALL